MHLRYGWPNWTDGRRPEIYYLQALGKLSKISLAAGSRQHRTSLHCTIVVLLLACSLMSILWHRHTMIFGAHAVMSSMREKIDAVSISSPSLHTKLTEIFSQDVPDKSDRNQLIGYFSEVLLAQMNVDYGRYHEAQVSVGCQYDPHRKWSIGPKGGSTTLSDQIIFDMFIENFKEAKPWSYVIVDSINIVPVDFVQEDRMIRTRNFIATSNYPALTPPVTWSGKFDIEKTVVVSVPFITLGSRCLITYHISKLKNSHWYISSYEINVTNPQVLSCVIF